MLGSRRSRTAAGLTLGRTTLNRRSDYIRHLRRRGLMPNTIEKIHIHLRAFENWLGRDLDTATTADIEVFLDTRHGRGHDNWTISDQARCDWISHFTGFYTWSIRATGKPSVNPVEAIMRPKLRRRLPRPISESDLELAMSKADRTMYAFLALGAFAGFRCCEMAWLTGESVLWHEGVLNVFGKGRKERIVEIHPVVTAALRSYGVPRIGPAFCKADGSQFSPRRVSQVINGFFTDLGINATAHQLRHRFGTQLYAACKNLRVVQEELGHAYSSTTDIYTAFARDEARAAVMALPIPGPELADDDEAA